MATKQLSEQQLRQIVSSAQTLEERLAGERPRGEGPAGDTIADIRIEKWRELAALGDREVFARRLALDNIDPNHIHQALAPGSSMPGEASLPGWAVTLDKCLQAAGAEEDPRDRCALDPGEPLPFEDLLLPFLRVARIRLEKRVGRLHGWLAENAHVSLERGLLQWLSYVAAPSFELEFSTFRATRRSGLTRLLEPAVAGPPSGEYQTFVARLRGGGLGDFFQEYSALARLVATVIDAWVESVTETLLRLDSDAPMLRKTFEVAGDLRPVTALDYQVSDRHRGGRAVWILEFAGGLKIVYKPRTLGIDRAWFGLLAWCTERGFPLPFRSLRVIDRSTHGWIEFAAARPCRNIAEAKRYYRRAGGLLCLVHLLEGTDLHFENVIACGEEPVLVDVETLLQPRLREMETLPEPEGARALALRRIWDSVIRTGLVPRWQLRGGGGYDLTGLGGGNVEQTISSRVRRWKNVNTDAMQVRSEPATALPRENAPTLNGVELSLADYGADVIDGFRRMHRFLSDNRGPLLAPGGPLAAFAGQRVRFLLRPTWLYGFLLMRSFNPESLRSGIDRSLELEMLTRAVLAPGARPELWGLLKEEKEALERCDIPLFDALTDSETLCLNSGQIVERLFDGTGMGRALASLQRMRDKDLEEQIDFIRGSFSSRLAAAAHGSGGPESNHSRQQAEVVAKLSRQELCRCAMDLAAQLSRRALRAGDGSVTWIAPQYIASAERYQLEPLSLGLYDGVAGVALFLAALERVTGSGELRPLTEGTLHSLHQECRSPRADEIGIGGGAGLGSIVYALTRISEFLEKPELLKQAEAIAARITPERIRADRGFDVLSGTAGAMLGLVALHRACGSELALQRIVECGHHLLANRVASTTGHRAWATSNGALLTGFSHGAAGIAHALLRGYQITGDGELAAAAEEAFDYERQVFDPAAGNWPDLRAKTDRRCGSSWCHGAPGCGFARVAALEVLDTEPIRSDLEAALAATRRCGIAEPDQLCCGSFGRTDFLWTAGEKLDRPELREIALEWGARIVRRAEQGAGFLCTPPGAFHPGFLQGLSGIGYELLRLAWPDRLRSVLLWE